MFGKTFSAASVASSNLRFAARRIPKDTGTVSWDRNPRANNDTDKLENKKLKSHNPQIDSKPAFQPSHSCYKACSNAVAN